MSTDHVLISTNVVRSMGPYFSIAGPVWPGLVRVDPVHKIGTNNLKGEIIMFKKLLLFLKILMQQ